MGASVTCQGVGPILSANQKVVCKFNVVCKRVISVYLYTYIYTNTSSCLYNIRQQSISVKNEIVKLLICCTLLKKNKVQVIYIYLINRIVFCFHYLTGRKEKKKLYIFLSASLMVLSVNPVYVSKNRSTSAPSFHPYICLSLHSTDHN